MPLDCQKRRPSSAHQLCRLQKYLALCGLGSRRLCETLIDSGRVSVDGSIVLTQGVRIDTSSAVVQVDGDTVSPKKHIYILFNKPRNVITTCSDPQNRQTFSDYLPTLDARVYPVGRLDRDSEGALILTNDGEMTHALTHPRRGAEKVYKVWINGTLTDDQKKLMLKGVDSEGQLLRVVNIRALMPGCCRIVLREGRKREIRRLFAKFKIKVTRLQRTAVGPLLLGRLAVGKWRYLTDSEVDALRQLTH